MPNPHVDPDIIALSVMLTTATVLIKYITFVWCLFPGLTLRYPILGIGKVYSALDEAVAAITVQRQWRQMRRERAYPGSSPTRQSRAYSRRRNTVSRPARGRMRAHTEFQLRFVQRIKASKLAEENFLRVQENCCGDMERTFGMATYMLTLGFCFKCAHAARLAACRHRCSV